MQERFNLGKPIVIADSGLLSNKNISALEEDGYEYILGARPKNENETIKRKILKLELKDGNVSVINKTETIRLIISMTNKRAHICICFTAWSIMLELERLLIANKSILSLKRAQEITYNMYQIVYQLPNSKDTKTQMLKMDREQQESYDVIMSTNPYRVSQ